MLETAEMQTVPLLLLLLLTALHPVDCLKYQRLLHRPQKQQLRL
jgi:hypothetical protein